MSITEIIETEKNTLSKRKEKKLIVFYGTNKNGKIISSTTLYVTYLFVRRAVSCHPQK